MRESLGLSIGTTNFVAVRAGEPPVQRRSRLTLFAHQPPQLGDQVAHHNGDTGLSITGFVERVGGREPVVATDGSTHLPDLLVVDAIDAMVKAAGAEASQLAIAVPGYWPAAAWQALQEALLADTDRPAAGGPPFLVSDAVAALTALDFDLGVPSGGVVALLDFGGGGTSITLADAGFGFQPIGETLRYHGFSGNLVDQAVLAHLLAHADLAEPAGNGTADLGDLAGLVDQCRRAKERLSQSDVAELVADLPGGPVRLEVTRPELERLIADSLDGAVAALAETLRSHGISDVDLTAIVTAGGGAQIPLVAERLSAAHRMPVVTEPRPTVAAAAGATLCAARQIEAGLQAATSSAPNRQAAATPSAPTAGSPAVTTDLPARTGVSSDAGDLAWSQEDANANLAGVVPFVDDRVDPGVGTGRRPALPPSAVERRRPSHRLPRLLIGIGALVALVAIVGAIHGLTTGAGDQSPVPPPADTSTVPATTPPASSAATSPARSTTPPSTTEPSPSAAPPPPETTSSEPSQTTTEPPETTTEPPETTTSQPTATKTPTTTPPPQTTTEPPPASVAATPTMPMTTEYLTIPLVPIPIPIQVPAG